MYKRWVQSILLLAATLLSIIAGLNFIIDPYNIFGNHLISLTSKPYMLSDRMSKFYIANRVKPKTIMMGTSRMGLFPEKYLSDYVDNPIYNLSLAGSTIDEQAAYIKYMIENHDIKNIVWSLDFFSFNPTKPIDPTFNLNRLQTKIYLNDIVISLIHYKTTINSFKTIIHQNDKVDMTLTADQVNQNISATLKEYATQKTFLNSETFKDPNSINKKIKILQEIIILCKKKKIRCILYTSPVYYKHIGMIYSIGLGKTFEYWKKALSDIASYTDLCTYNVISMNISNFRDSSHVQPEVGKIIFKNVFENEKSFKKSIQ